MIATIYNFDGDIDIFLTNEEIKKLKEKSLVGEIFVLQDIRKMYPLEIILDKEFDTNDSKSRNTIHTVISSDGRYTTYISASKVSNYYQELLERKWIGTRDANTKIDIMSEEFAKNSEEFKMDYRLSKSLYEHKELAIKKLNEREKENQ